MSTPPSIPTYTYHCLCSTLLLATPYPLSRLPRRAPPSLDHAYILPLPPPSRPSDPRNPTTDNHNTSDVATIDSRSPRLDGENGEEKGKVLPSLLIQNLKPARKAIVLRREDGFEKRRVYRCARCGVGVGYEVLGDMGGEGEGRVIFLLEGGLVETGEMGA